jgi:hypothetical protein
LTCLDDPRNWKCLLIDFAICQWSVAGGQQLGLI